MIFNRLLRGHSPNFSRFMFVIVLLLCLPFIQCSKGNGVIAPDSLSGGGVNTDDGGFGSILQDSERISQDENSGFPTQMTPILSKDSFDQIDKGVALALGESDFPENEVMHISAEPEGKALSNPPVLRFAFAAKPDVIKPEEISVSVDGVDISSLIHYNYFYNQARKANYYVAHYTPDVLISPERNYHLEINYTPQKGRAIAKSCTFDVPEPEDSSVILAGFTADKIPTDKAPSKTNYRELLVHISNPIGVKEGSRLLNTERWKLEYLDKAPFPAICDIKKIREGAYLISLAENAKPGSECSISFEMLKDMSTQKFEFLVPRELVEREGGLAREGMAACCQGSFETVIPHSAENCEMYHTIDFDMVCPGPPCEGDVDEYTTVMEYSFLNNFDDPYVDSEIGYIPNPFILHQGWSCVSSYQQPYDARSDFLCNFFLTGYDGQGNFCGTLGSVGPCELKSDNLPPRVQANIIKDIDCGERPDCTDCEKQEIYSFTITGWDDHCIYEYPRVLAFLEESTFCIEGPLDWLLDPNTNYDYTHGDHNYQRTFYLSQANLGCIKFLKIVMLDWKGNWGSTKLVSWADDENGYNQLPYPTSISLSFDDENRESDKQYVNLDRQLILNNPTDPCMRDQEVCAFKTDHPDRGEFIYMEVTVDPPIQGITVFVEYEDPQFVKAPDLLPTNQVDVPGAPVADYSSGQNRDLTLREHMLLWGSHPPYGCDYVTLGDNYNYFDSPNHEIPASVPADDPIRFPHPTPIRAPFFTNCREPNFPQVPQDCYCTDLVTSTPWIKLTTNIHGKAAVYFYTGGHGGDNFKFKAYTMSQYCLFSCLRHDPERIFTNWRRIYVDYAWMESRDRYPSPLCQWHGDEQIEYEDAHEIGYYSYGGIGPDQFDHYKGVFDDCFIEILPSNEIGNTAYYLALNASDRGMSYTEYLDYLFPLNPDTILLGGVDHLDGKCITDSSEFGRTVFIGNDKCFVAVGLFFDLYENAEGYYRRIDNQRYTTMFYPMLNSAAHELGHKLLDDTGHILTYGLMTAGEREMSPSDNTIPARRSYFHSSNIIDLRTECSY